ncbi:phage scaffolding protein [Ethanoligenens sp.]|uniref:phage scaffolding protein n=1 Tax=Ethanoligenens sp. TaxID=2099655 RepID=UPI0039EA91E5
MKKDELTTIGLTDEQAAQVFALHGKDITKLQGTVTALTDERDTLKSQLGEANTQIEGFKKLDVDGIQRAADDWKAKYEKATADFESVAAACNYDDAVKTAAAGINFTSVLAKNAFVGLLKDKALKLDGGKLIGFDDILKQAQTDDPSAFASDKPAPKFTTPITTPAPEVTKEAFAKMSYLDKLKLKNEQPDAYKALREAK